MNNTVPPPKRPSLWQALVMLGSGIVLGFGGCSAFLSSFTSGYGEAWALGGMGFVLGVFLTMVGTIRLRRATWGKEQRDDK